MDTSEHIVAVGYAKVPAGSALGTRHEVLSVVLLVDRVTHRILEVESTAVTGIVRRWLADLLVGRDLTQPMDDVLALVESAYLGHASGAVRQAIHDAARRYATALHQRSEGGRP